VHGPVFARARTRALGVFLGVSVLCLAPAVHADDAQAAKPAAQAPAQDIEPPGYAIAIDTAVSEHDAGHFAEARTYFVRAHQLYPNARTLRGLGMVEFELRNYGESARYLEEALASQAKPLDDKLRKETQGLLARARAYIGEVHVAVDPGSATVMVDGVTVASGPEASFTLVVGDHELEFRAHGRLSEKRALHINGGEETSMRVVLTHPEGDPSGPRVLMLNTQPAHSEVEPLRKKWWLWTAVGAVLAGSAVAIALGVRSQHKDVHEGEPIKSDNLPTGAVVMALGER